MVMKKLRERFDSPELQDGLLRAVEEAQRTASARRVRRMSVVLASALAGDFDNEPEDIVSFIQTISELTDGDIQVLVIMEAAYAWPIKHMPNLNDPNAFTERYADLMKLVDEAKIHRDDFYSRCVRLSGFALAMEVVRNTSRQTPADHCFRPTLRGLRLLRMLHERETGQSAAGTQ